MKFYVEITCRRVIELDAEDYESALSAADHQVSALLPERDAWQPRIEVSAVQGIGDDRYYVHRQAPNRFLVRERQQENQSGPDDPIIRPFDEREDAHHYAHTMNEVQRELDRRYGRWARHAVTPQDTSREQTS